MSELVDDGHIEFAQSSLNYFQQTAHEVANAMLEEIAEARKVARLNTSPAQRRQARERIIQAKGQADAYNALIAMAGDIAGSLPKFKGARLADLIQETRGAESVEEKGARIILPEG